MRSMAMPRRSHHGEARQAEHRVSAGEGHTVVRPDRQRKAAVPEDALEHGESKGLLRGGQGLTAQQVAARGIGDRQRIAVSTISQHELALVVRAPELVWLERSRQLRALRTRPAPFPLLHQAMAIQDGYDDRGPLDPAKLFKRRGIGGGLGAVIRFTDSFRCEPAEDGSGKTVIVIRYRKRPKRRSPGA